MLRFRSRGRERRLVVMATFALAAGVPLAGCTGLEPAVVGAGATAAESGASLFERGKVTGFEPVRFEDAVDAVRYTAEKLALSVVCDEPGEGREAGRYHRFVLRDEEGESLVVSIERRTEAVTRIHADVGTFGPTPMVGLVMGRTIERLRRTGAYERVWPTPRPPSTGPGGAKADGS